MVKMKKWRRKACERSFAETAGDPVNFVDLWGRKQNDVIAGVIYDFDDSRKTNKEKLK